MSGAYSDMSASTEALRARVAELEDQLEKAFDLALAYDMASDEIDRLRVRHLQVLDNLTSVQERCTELLLENRALRSDGTFDDYQRSSARTLNLELSKHQSLCDYGLGLAGESGEVIEPIKKHVFHGKPLCNDEMAKEIGDVLWYVAALATTLGLSLSDIANRNVEKLRARWPNGWLK